MFSCDWRCPEISCFKVWNWKRRLWSWRIRHEPKRLRWLRPVPRSHHPRLPRSVCRQKTGILSHDERILNLINRPLKDAKFALLILCWQNRSIIGSWRESMDCLLTESWMSPSNESGGLCLKGHFAINSQCTMPLLAVSVIHDSYIINEESASKYDVPWISSLCVQQRKTNSGARSSTFAFEYRWVSGRLRGMKRTDPKFQVGNSLLNGWGAFQDRTLKVSALIVANLGDRHFKIAVG